MADLGETLKASALGAICPIWKYTPLQVGLELAKLVVPLISPTAPLFTPINQAVSGYLDQACNPITGPANPQNPTTGISDPGGLEYCDLTYTPLNPNQIIPRRIYFGCVNPKVVSFALNGERDFGSQTDFYGITTTYSSGQTQKYFEEVLKGTGAPSFAGKSCGSGAPAPATGGGYPPIAPADGPKIQIFAPIIAGIAGVGLAGALQVNNNLTLAAEINASVNNLNLNLNALSITIGGQGQAQKDCCAEILGRLAAIIAQLTVIQTFEGIIDDDVKSVLKVLGFGRDGSGPPYIGRGPANLITLREILQDLAKRLGYDSTTDMHPSFDVPMLTSTVAEEFDYLRSKMGFAGKYLIQEEGKPAIPESEQPHSIEEVIKNIVCCVPDDVYETDKLLTIGLGKIVEITPTQPYREITIDVPVIGIYTFIAEFPNYLSREVNAEERYDFGSYRYTDNAPGTEPDLTRSMGPRYPLVYERQYIPGGPNGTRVRFRVVQDVRLRFFRAGKLEDKPPP